MLVGLESVVLGLCFFGGGGVFCCGFGFGVLLLGFINKHNFHHNIVAFKHCLEIMPIMTLNGA